MLLGHMRILNRALRAQDTADGEIGLGDTVQRLASHLVDRDREV